MPDQLGSSCAAHDPLHCSCDEVRDRAAGVHRASGVDNGFGGYLCICGSPTPVYCPPTTPKESTDA